MMKDWLDASLFYVSNEPGFRVNTNPRRTYTISLSSSMMYIRQIQILVQAQICTWLIVYTKRQERFPRERFLPFAQKRRKADAAFRTIYSYSVLCEKMCIL